MWEVDNDEVAEPSEVAEYSEPADPVSARMSSNEEYPAEASAIASPAAPGAVTEDTNLDKVQKIRPYVAKATVRSRVSTAQTDSVLKVMKTKRYQPVIPQVESAMPGHLGSARKLLSTFAKENSSIDLKSYPREHFARMQCVLLSQDLSRGIKMQDMTYVIYREGLENLWYLMEYCKTDDPKAAGILAYKARKIVVVMESIASKMEELSGVTPTNWTRVAELLYTESGNVHQAGPPYGPAKLKYFTMGTLLGAGGFGAVFKGYFGDAVITMKLVPCERLMEPKYACSDKLVASMVNHPFVVKYFACFATRQAFVTCMEYIRGVDLAKVLKVAGYFPEKINRLIMAQLGVAIQHMHIKGFMHRDIKPANMMILPGCRVKLIDFDTAKVSIGKYVQKNQGSFNWRTSSEFCDNEVAGTPGFFPPECVSFGGYGRSMDWWACGVTAYNMATGRMPFQGRTDQEQQKLIASCYYSWPKSVTYSSNLKGLVAAFLKKRTHERLCSVRYSDFQEHPFFAGMDWHYLETTDYIKDFPVIANCLKKTPSGTYSPVGSPAAQQRKQNLFPTQIVDTTEHCNLYTFCSPGFCRALIELKSGNAVSLEQLNDPPEYLQAEAEVAYKFDDI